MLGEEGPTGSWRPGIVHLRRQLWLRNLVQVSYRARRNRIRVSRSWSGKCLEMVTDVLQTVLETDGHLLTPDRQLIALF